MTLNPGFFLEEMVRLISMIRIKYSLVFFTILNYQCSTNCEKEMESNSLEYTKNEYQLDLNNLSLLDPLIERNFKNCYIAVLDTHSNNPLLKLNLGYHRTLKLNVISFGERLIAIDYLGTKDLYVREERVFVFGDPRGVLKYNFIVDGNKVRFTGFSVFMESTEKNYAFIDPNPFLERPNYLDSILGCSTSLLFEQDFDYSEFKYSISNDQLFIKNTTSSNLSINFMFNLDSLPNCIDYNNIKVSVFCLR